MFKCTRIQSWPFQGLLFGILSVSSSPDSDWSTRRCCRTHRRRFPLKLSTAQRGQWSSQGGNFGRFIAPVKPQHPALKLMLLTPVLTQTCTMLRRPGDFSVCGKWSQPAQTFPLWWGDVFLLSNRSGKNMFSSDKYKLSVHVRFVMIHPHSVWLKDENPEHQRWILCVHTAVSVSFST